MKKLLIAAFACITLTIFGCSKNDTQAPILTSITGTWQYIGYSGGLAGFKFTPQPAQNFIQVDADGNRIMFKSGDTTQNCGTFTFQKDAADYGGLLTVNGNIFGSDLFGNRYNVSLQHDTLSLYPADCMDCFEAHYKAVDKHFNWCSSDAGTNH